MPAVKRRAVEKMVAIPLEEREPPGPEDPHDPAASVERDIALDGIYLGVSAEEGRRPEPRGGAVVAAPHPAYGGSMDNPVVTELALACERAGFETLRFNWRGVGASGGEVTGDPEAALEDMRAALRHMGETSDGPLVACGYSFGAVAAVRAARHHRRVQRLVLVAPPAAMLDVPELAAFPGRVLVLVGALDRLADPDALEARTAELASVRLERIPDADHFFGVGLGAIHRLTADFLA